jgi:CLIP-associating protein 1/2
VGGQGRICPRSGRIELKITQMHKTEGLPFKTYVPQLVACLEDADGMVRETAKSCTVELFRYVQHTPSTGRPKLTLRQERAGSRKD